MNHELTPEDAALLSSATAEKVKRQTGHSGNETATVVSMSWSEGNVPYVVITVPGGRPGKTLTVPSKTGQMFYPGQRVSIEWDPPAGCYVTGSVDMNPIPRARASMNCSTEPIGVEWTYTAFADGGGAALFGGDYSTPSDLGGVIPGGGVFGNDTLTIESAILTFDEFVPLDATAATVSVIINNGEYPINRCIKDLLADPTEGPLPDTPWLENNLVFDVAVNLGGDDGYLVNPVVVVTFSGPGAGVYTGAWFPPL